MISRRDFKPTGDLQKNPYDQQVTVPYLQALVAELRSILRRAQAALQAGWEGDGQSRLTAMKILDEPAEDTCPICGYYCLGNGGLGCLDKPATSGLKTKPVFAFDFVRVVMLPEGDKVELVMTGRRHPIRSNPPDHPISFQVEVTKGDGVRWAREVLGVEPVVLNPYDRVIR